MVRDGEEVFLPHHPKDPEHEFLIVHREMLLQIMREFPSLGDWRVLRASEIRFFYSSLVHELKKATEKKAK